jgi:hypothetical protein
MEQLLAGFPLLTMHKQVVADRGQREAMVTHTIRLTLAMPGRTAHTVQMEISYLTFLDVLVAEYTREGQLPRIALGAADRNTPRTAVFGQLMLRRHYCSNFCKLVTRRKH